MDEQEPVFRKEDILQFKRYANRRDLLTALLKEGELYTREQVDKLLSDFMTGERSVT